MSLQHLDLTTALRPTLLSGETLLFVQDDVGLYQGKLKIAHLQQGQAYLTSHRVCYVDNEEPRKYSVAINLRDLETYDFYAGFLKSSPKITFHLKAASRTGNSTGPSSSANGLVSSSPRGASPSPVRSSTPVTPALHNATWICPICTFSNPLPPTHDPSSVTASTPMPSCLACGIKPAWTHILRATIASLSRTQSIPPLLTNPTRQESQRSLSPGQSGGNESAVVSATTASDRRLPSALPCPRCTFLNDPGLLSCEICGGPLVAQRASDELLGPDEMERSGSPGASISATRLVGSELAEIKFSFRGGGEKVFYDRLKGAMIQRKWLLEGAPSIPKPLQSFDADAPRDDARRPEEGAGRAKIAGIAGLEQRDLALRKQNELVIGNAFADLEALMTSAKEIVALAEKFAERLPGNSAAGSSEASAVLSRSAAALGLVTTKDMLSTGSTSETLYLSQLSRNLAEFLTDDATGILRREGGIMSLVDLWAVFNRARGGVELVSPTDFRKAVDMWEKLRLPLRLRRFRSGLLVVQGKDWSDDKTLASVAAWLQELHTADAVPPGAAWDWRLFGRGVTPRETAERFRWSVGVATEELEMAEENGFLCREESVEGVRFWENWLVADLAGPSWSSEAPPGTSSNDLVAAEQGVTSLTL